MSVSGARASCAAIAVAIAAFLVACSDDTRSAVPSPEAIATAEAESTPVTIGVPSAATAQRGDGDAEDVTLRGHAFGSGRVGVILAPMRPADQTAWFPFASVLAATGGFTALTFDFRGFGESPGEQDFGKLDADLTAAYQYMRDQLGIEKIFLAGASMGGTAAIVVASRLEVAGVAAISALEQFQTLDALHTVQDVAAPKLFIVSKDDVPAMRSQEDLWMAAPDPKEREIYQGDAHGTDIFAGPQGDAVVQRLIAFLTSH